MRNRPSRLGSTTKAWIRSLEALYGTSSLVRLCVAAVFLFVPLTCALGQETCPAPLERLALHQRAVNSTLEASLLSQGQSEPPDESNQVPWDPAVWDDAIRSKLRRELEQARLLAPSTLVYIFEDSDTAHLESHRIPVAKSAFWCLVRPGDNVVLIWGANSHTTTVFEVDRAKGRLYLVDPWPEAFLIPDAELVPYPDFMRSRGRAVDARFLDKLLVSVERDRFLRQIRSLQTMDDHRLREHFFDISPHEKANPAVHQAFGWTFFNGLTFHRWYDNRFMDLAVSSFTSAMETAAAKQDEKAERAAAQRLHLAARIARYEAIKRRDHDQVSQMKDFLKRISIRFDAGAIEDTYTALNWFQLGIAAGDTRNNEAAVSYFDKALERDKSFSEALLGKAVANHELRRYAESVENASRVIKLASVRRAALTEVSSKRGVDDIIGRALDADEASKIEFMERQAVRTRHKSVSRVLAFRDPENQRQIIPIAERIQSVDPGGAVAILGRALTEGTDRFVRAEVCRSLGKMRGNEDAANRLQNALAHDDKWNVRQSAILGLMSIGPVGDRALPQILTALEDDNFDVQYTAGQFLDIRLGQDASAAIKAVVDTGDGTIVRRAIGTLSQGVSDERDEVAEAMAHALTRIVKSLSPQAIEDLRGELETAGDLMMGHANEHIRSHGATINRILASDVTD